MTVGVRLIVGFLSAVCASSASAQTFPMRPVTVVVSSAPGVAHDAVMRMLQPRLQERLGQPVIVDNKPGASGQIGTLAVVKEPADGYTLLLAPDTHVINPVASPNLPYDIFRDLTPVSLLIRFPFVVSVHDAVPAKSLTELVALARAQPGKLNFPSPGVASIPFLAMEDFSLRAGVRLTHVPYRGAAAMGLALSAGEVQLGLMSAGSLRPMMQEHKARPLAIAGDNRVAELPDVPTTSEAGDPKFKAQFFAAVFAPAGVPSQIIVRLNREIVAALKEPEAKAKIEAMGLEVVASSPEELGRYVADEYKRWSTLAREAHVRFD